MNAHSTVWANTIIMSCAVDVSDLEKNSNPEMDLACKNTLRNQISSFYDMYHAIYGRLSILYTTSHKAGSAENSSWPRVCLSVRPHYVIYTMENNHN